MTRQTTAIVLVGSKTTSAWGDRLLRPTHVVRFTQNSVPGWQVHPLNGATGVSKETTPRGTTAAVTGMGSRAQELVVLVAALIVRDEAVLEAARGVGALRTEGDGSYLKIPDRGFSEHLVELAVNVVAQECQFWIMPLDEQCALLEDGTAGEIQEWGIECDLRATSTAVDARA